MQNFWSTPCIRIFEKIDVAMLELVIHNFLIRLEQVIEMNGERIENILY